LATRWSILGFTRVALANAKNRNENQITSGYRWWAPVAKTKVSDPVNLHHFSLPDQAMSLRLAYNEQGLLEEGTFVQ
jgi:hypothetical protein